MVSAEEAKALRERFEKFSRPEVSEQRILDLAYTVDRRALLALVDTLTERADECQQQWALAVRREDALRAQVARVEALGLVWSLTRDREMRGRGAAILKALAEPAAEGGDPPDSDDLRPEWGRDPYDEPVTIQGHLHSEPICVWPECDTYLTYDEMAAAQAAKGGRAVTQSKATLPISLPMGKVFGDRSTRSQDGALIHKCWFCSSKAERHVRYPPMPPGCTLCGRCGVLIYTAEDDRDNEAMIVCQECETALSEGGEQ